MGIDRSTLYNYCARYYTYTLYDSSAYYPFNEETADDDETGYNYSYSDYEESLAYLYVEDLNSSTPAITTFIDYSTCDQDIEVGRTEDVDEEDDDSDGDGVTVWLLISSICLVAALLVALCAIFVKDLIKKIRRGRTAGKNTYNFNKNKRYVKKYVKANGEAPVNGNATDKANDAIAETDNANDNDES